MNSTHSIEVPNTLKLNKALKSSGKGDAINDKLKLNHLKLNKMSSQKKLIPENLVQGSKPKGVSKIQEFLQKSHKANSSNSKKGTRKNSSNVNEGKLQLATTGK